MFPLYLDLGKRPKKGLATAKQRLGKILKIHRNGKLLLWEVLEMWLKTWRMRMKKRPEVGLKEKETVIYIFYSR